MARRPARVGPQAVGCRQSEGPVPLVPTPRVRNRCMASSPWSVERPGERVVVLRTTAQPRELKRNTAKRIHAHRSLSVLTRAPGATLIATSRRATDCPATGRLSGRNLLEHESARLRASRAPSCAVEARSGAPNVGRRQVETTAANQSPPPQSIDLALPLTNLAHLVAGGLMSTKGHYREVRRELQGQFSRCKPG